ncbi:hypothetical protein M514_17280 [Trichuris suis]|uniref:ISXO2-like transposase domain-containing protein n=1 Tax=Trichuris suis TaxID=68888 RepID=A0A085NLZ1_9BILA|nr:hypothetical protein M514_17280 [Trichuris suis]
MDHLENSVTTFLVIQFLVWDRNRQSSSKPPCPFELKVVLFRYCHGTVGSGCTVEVDESLFGKRKSNRGSMLDRSGFLVACAAKRENASWNQWMTIGSSTLVPVIQRHVLPGSTVITDECAVMPIWQTTPGKKIAVRAILLKCKPVKHNPAKLTNTRTTYEYIYLMKERAIRSHRPFKSAGVCIIRILNHKSPERSKCRISQNRERSGSRMDRGFEDEIPGSSKS